MFVCLLLFTRKIYLVFDGDINSSFIHSGMRYGRASIHGMMGCQIDP